MEKNYKQMAQDYIIYGKKLYDEVIDRGEGVYLYDINGKKYIDAMAGIAVNALGYSNEKYKNALKAQIDKVTHISAYFTSVPLIEAAQKIVTTSKMSKVFFTNSGTEAIEGALKIARKYGALKGIKEQSEIIAMEHSFHGRTMGSLACTANDKYQGNFVPSQAKAVFAKFNDIESVKNKITKNTCGIICEVIQGEGGIIPANKEFLQGLRKLCDENDLILIFDEVQCGMGRCGSLYAHDLYGVKPDVMALAKALGCGIPVGAFVVNEKTKDILAPGEHGNTYGGNPLATAAVCAVFDIFEELNILEHVKEVGEYFKQKLDELVNKYSCIIERRGIGLMQGIVVNTDLSIIEKKAYEKGLLVCAAGTNVIRLVPPLIIEKNEIDEIISILNKCFAEIS